MNNVNVKFNFFFFISVIISHLKKILHFWLGCIYQTCVWLFLSYFFTHVFVECTDSNPCEGLSRHATFENFGMAFLTLFRVSTGDNWNGIMKVLYKC